MNYINDLLKKAREEGQGVSLTREINKACESGVTSSGAFSVLGIKRGLRGMLRTLEEQEEFDREEFFKEFSKFYGLVMAPDKRAKGVFHPSQLQQGCSRQMTYDLMRVPPSDKVNRQIGGELQRTFDVGSWYHVYIQNILYNVGALKQAEVPVVNEDRFINGKADGVLKKKVFGEEVVLEIKSMNDWNFKKAIFQPFAHHEYQASIYARELGIEKVLYLYINKNTSEIKEFLCPVNKELLKDADAKMDRIINHVKKGTLPKRSCADKFCDSALQCPFATKCFEDE